MVQPRVCLLRPNRSLSSVLYLYERNCPFMISMICDFGVWGTNHALSLLQLTLARYEQVQYSIPTNYVDPKTNPRHATRFLQHVNHGALANKHLGLRNADGKTATRVPNALVKILARLQTTVVYCMFDCPWCYLYMYTKYCHIFWTVGGKPSATQSPGIIGLC